MSPNKKYFFKLFKSFLGSAPLKSRKMVRFLPNNFPDHKPGSIVAVNKEDFLPLINEYVQYITTRLSPVRKNVEGGLYVGVTGVAYMFFHLSKNLLLSESKQYYLDKSSQYLKPGFDCSAGDRTSFLVGDAGTLAIATVIYKALGNNTYHHTKQAYVDLCPEFLDPKFLPCGGDEFFVGRAGYIAGALWMSREIKEIVVPNIELYKICDMIVDSGRSYCLNHQSPCPLMYHYYKTEYLGAAHGLSFILQMLLTVPGYLEHNASAAGDVKTTIDYLLSLQLPDGNWPCCIEEVGALEHRLVHWCHGAPGIVFLMAKAYQVYQEDIYLNACVKGAAVVWEKGLLLKGPGICHGIAGNGYVFLLLFRLTKDDKYLYRAQMFAEALKSEEFLSNARIPDNPESLYEGRAGTLCFLSDLLQPHNAEFPFQDVFTDFVTFQTQLAS